jgi:hypothetical protein
VEASAALSVRFSQRRSACAKMGVDYYVCSACDEVVCEYSFTSCKSCEDERICLWCAKSANTGKNMTAAEFAKVESFSKRFARAKAAYAHEKACIAAELHGEPKPQAPPLPEEESEQEQEGEGADKGDDDKKEWYCSDCAGCREVEAGPKIQTDDVVAYLLEKAGIDLETAKAAARRAQIMEEIVKEDSRRVVRKRVLRKQAPTAAAAAEEKPDQPGRKRKARSEP